MEVGRQFEKHLYGVLPNIHRSRFGSRICLAVPAATTWTTSLTRGKAVTTMSETSSTKRCSQALDLSVLCRRKRQGPARVGLYLLEGTRARNTGRDAPALDGGRPPDVARTRTYVPQRGLATLCQRWISNGLSEAILIGETIESPSKINNTRGRRRSPFCIARC